MKSFLLLILSLMTGCEASSEVKVCARGWVELTFKYPKPNGNYKIIEVVSPLGTTIRSTGKDLWEDKDIFSLYHDTKNKILRTAIKPLKPKDFGDYMCKFGQGSNSSPETKELELEKDGCKKPFSQTAYKTAKTTITCDYRNKYKSMVKFVCKDNNLICEDILSTQSSPKSNRTFALTDTNSGFTMSISNLSSQHAGVYWCGVESDNGSNRVSVRKIQLEIEGITSFKRSPTIGQTFTYWCEYPQNAPIKKFICKGEDPSICQSLWSTAKLNRNPGKFSVKDDKVRNITITVRDVTTDDTGTYWCGADNTDKRRSNPFFNKLEMAVVPPTPLPPSTAERNDFWVTIAIITVICVAVLLLVLILVLVYKRYACSKYKTNEEGQNNAEVTDLVYEEIEENPHKPDSGTALKTIYVTANHPTNPSAFTHHSNINRPNSSGEVSDDTYSTVKDNDQCPIYSTVNHPIRFSEVPLYSTVNKPQEH